MVTESFHNLFIRIQNEGAQTQGNTQDCSFIINNATVVAHFCPKRRKNNSSTS